MVMYLFRHHFRRELGGLLGWGAAVAATVVLFTAAFTFLLAVRDQIQPMLSQYPPQILRFVGGAVTLITLPGWLGGMVFTGVMPLLIAIWVAIGSVGVVTADRDQGTLEFVLALPVRRWQMLAERWLSFVLQLAALFAIEVVAVLVGLVLIGQSQPAGPLAAAMVLQWLTQAALGGMLLLLSLAFRDQVKAVLATVTGALVFAFLPTFVDPSSSLVWLRKLSPFAYSLPGNLLTGGAFPWGDAVLLLVWAAAGFALSLLYFGRQEV